MEIAIPLYDRFTALDAVGPYEVLWRVPGARVRWIGAEARPYATDRGLQLVAEATFEDVASPDVLVVPGGTGTLAALEDRRLLDWIRRADATTTRTTSVCTGALLLGAARGRTRSGAGWPARRRRRRSPPPASGPCRCPTTRRPT